MDGRVGVPFAEMRYLRELARCSIIVGVFLADITLGREANDQGGLKARDAEDRGLGCQQRLLLGRPARIFAGVGFCLGSGSLGPSGRRSWGAVSQGVGLRPRPWAGVSRPVGPAVQPELFRVRPSAALRLPRHPKPPPRVPFRDQLHLVPPMHLGVDLRRRNRRMSQ
jgi:hypothetical protein